MASEKHDLETMGAVPINSFGEYEAAMKVINSMNFKFFNTDMILSDNDQLERKILARRLAKYEIKHRIVKNE